MGAPEQQRRAIQNKAFQTLIQKLLSNGENAHLLKMLKTSKINCSNFRRRRSHFGSNTLLPLDDCLAVYNSALLACIAVITFHISNSQSIFMTLSWLTIMQRDSKLLMVLLLLNLYVLSAPELFILNPYHHTLELYI